ncbi:uncharacterized protein LOC142173761 [Nicotiana tabacum]|uniref:Uncharacterized protein LOC142173761 n=1 Tax=Nicotiana tabacum TaxID=4097 RepID=A0AC58TE75_TOBAC
MATKLLNKAGAWQCKLLSFGGRAFIINHVLQSQTLYLMAAMAPPKTIIKQIEMYLSNYLWGEKEGKKSYHWCSWDNMSFSLEEGGVGFKKLQDICNSFAVKRWWRFIIEDNLWTKISHAKYCPRSNPLSKVTNSKDSSSWRNLLEIRDKAENNILWKINSANSLFWWDIWTSSGSIEQLANPNYKPGNIKVSEYLCDRKWNIERLQDTVFPKVIQQINDVHIGNPRIKDHTLNAKRSFTCSSAYQLLRTKRGTSPLVAKIWNKDLPFKISFNTWRILKNKLPLNEVLQKIGKGLFGKKVESNGLGMAMEQSMSSCRSIQAKNSKFDG